MKNLILSLAVSVLSLAAAAQDADGGTAAMERIKADRGRVEAIFRAEEKACYGKFAVNDCLNAARARRRQALADLRRQEVLLNDAERRRRAAERLREMEERTSAENQRKEAEQRAAAAARQQRRESQAAEKRADRAERPSKEGSRTKAARAPRPAQQKKARQGEQRIAKPEETRRNVERHEERLLQAEQRREKLEKRLAARKKPPAQPLPVPP